MYQKRFEIYELPNLTNSHGSVAPHSLQSHQMSALPSGGGSSKHEKDKDKDKKTKVVQQVLRDDSPEKEPENSITNEDISSPEIKNIDDVFIRITDIYTQEIYNIIYNTLNIMLKNDTGFDIYIDGLNKLLEPTNSRIKKWIDEHIVF